MEITPVIAFHLPLDSIHNVNVLHVYVISQIAVHIQTKHLKVCSAQVGRLLQTNRLRYEEETQRLFNVCQDLHNSKQGATLTGSLFLFKHIPQSTLHISSLLRLIEDSISVYVIQILVKLMICTCH